MLSLCSNFYVLHYCIVCSYILLLLCYCVCMGMKGDEAYSRVHLHTDQGYGYKLCLFSSHLCCSVHWHGCSPTDNMSVHMGMCHSHLTFSLLQLAPAVTSACCSLLNCFDSFSPGHMQCKICRWQPIRGASISCTALWTSSGGALTEVQIQDVTLNHIMYVIQRVTCDTSCM